MLNNHNWSIHIPLKLYSLLIYNYRVLYSKEVTPKKIEMWSLLFLGSDFFYFGTFLVASILGIMTIPKLGNQKKKYKGKTRQRVLNTRTDVVFNVTQPFPRWWVWWLIIDSTRGWVNCLSFWDERWHFLQWNTGGYLFLRKHVWKKTRFKSTKYWCLYV